MSVVCVCLDVGIINAGTCVEMLSADAWRPHYVEIINLCLCVCTSATSVLMQAE